MVQIIIQYWMQQERNSRASQNSFLNRQQYEDRRSSFCSLDRFSDKKSLSLNKKYTMIMAMDIEDRDSKKKSIYDELTGGQNRFSDCMRNSDRSKEQYEYRINESQIITERISNCKIIHQCKCTADQCNQEHCICFLSPKEICVIGLCCQNCIAKKNYYLQNTKGYRLAKEKVEQEENKKKNFHEIIKNKKIKNMHYIKHAHPNEPEIKDLIFCTCKKSHCQKKYCLCFEKGQKCGDYCICEECLNIEFNDEDESKSEKERKWERYSTVNRGADYGAMEEEIDSDIEQYLEEQMLVEEFNEKMEFEPVNFEQAFYQEYT